MTDEERKRSYEHYKQWQMNKITYRNECIAYVLLVGAGLWFVLKNWEGILFAIGFVAIIFSFVRIFRIIRKWYRMRRGLLHLEQMAKEAGAKNIKIDLENNSIRFTMSPEITDDALDKFETAMKKEGLKFTISRQTADNSRDECIKETNKMESSDLKSTEPGYINRNNQRNNGRSEERGTDNNQWFYYMECLNCGEKYKANGSDIFQRKCPACQGGKS